MTSPDQPGSFTPRMPVLIAAVAFIIAALTLCYPMLTGQYVAGDDQVIAGYGFRLFGAEYFRAHGSIPEWNPYLFGGMPFVAAMHGDIFYPTAWLRWFVPTDIAMTFGFFIHLVIAGLAMYALLRALGASWTASVAAGIGYELSGILASMLANGHDGKLFVAALAPFALLALLRGIRHGRLASFGVYALIIGLCMLSPHYQLTYYLLVASGLWTLWLVFRDPDRAVPKAPARDLGLAAVGVILGVGIGMIQGLPFLKYIPYSPRVDGGASSGWEYATQFSMPIEEIMTTVLPQFNGITEHYWGVNHFKSHTEYLGAIIVILAVLGLGAAKRRGLLTGLGIIAALFLLISFGGHTPFYRLWYEVMPMMQKVRASGMAFFLVALPVCVWAGFGVDRVLRREVSARQIQMAVGVIAVIALLGAVGLLQGFASALAEPQMMQRVTDNAGELRLGSIRLLLVVLIGGATLLAVQAAKLRGAGAAVALAAVVLADQWSVLKHFAEFLPPASVTYADDQLTTAMKQSSMPFRAYEPSGELGAGGAVYAGAWLMANHVPTLFGYHGNESRFFDELFGVKNVWENQFSPTLLDLYAARYIVANQDVSTALAGYTLKLGPVAFPNLTGRRAQAGYLFERDTVPQWVRVVPAAVKLPDAQIVATVVGAGFPLNSVVLYPDTMALAAPTLSELPTPSAVTAKLEDWGPGRMTVALSGSDPRTTYLLVAENWYPGWIATIDGQVAPTRRANHAMLSVALPSGAKTVELTYHTPGYGTGKLITLISLVGALGLVITGRLRRRGVDG